MIAAAARAVLVLAVLAATALLLRRRARPAALDPVLVLSRAPLGPGMGVALVEADGRRLLVGWGKDGVRLVRDLGGAGGRP